MIYRDFIPSQQVVMKTSSLDQITVIKKSVLPSSITGPPYFAGVFLLFFTLNLTNKKTVDCTEFKSYFC